MTKRGLLCWAAAAALSASTAGADVRAGVEAWKRGDYARALAEWRAPAERGNADAQFNMGQAYKLGRGVAADQARAIDWFRKAAAQGHVPAQDNYGLALFQSGRKADAVPWLERSAARDERRAELVLGTMLFNGDPVARDLTRAYALVTRSAQQGLTQASATLARMEPHVSEAQRRDALAMAQQIAARGQPAAVASATVAGSAPAVRAPAPLPAPARAAGAAPARPTPAPAPSVTAAAARPEPARQVAASGGGWRVQLGAFRDPANARALWQKVGAQVGGTPAYPQSGGLTRLQATGFASKVEAQRACDRLSDGCVVVAP